ncbi:lytic transglycosylase [Cytobacillus dafuensis]|uniref:LysM peptidoglycan-binding domain-containing protein n=1 Tax=Cytobacillus dafuensis TaxID=1742359 RepID=A0A5B8ZAG2_CYTDA|nr:transglycosylase SLT domain-containing protein [Cytobacillus dafuensis]QED49914.1 LysM peptidoglycan-binding domain-containing protein [Cytobacillus dafuensis]
MSKNDNRKFTHYTVREGDTLWGLSKKFGVTFSQLKELNNLSSDTIFIDQVLRIKEFPEIDDIILPPDLINNDRILNWITPIKKFSLQYEIPFPILFGIMLAESSGDPYVVSKKGAIGLMQLLPQTANWLSVNPCDPIQSIDGAARYVKELFDEFKDWELVVAAYNAGPDKVKQYGGIPPIEETREYVQTVFSYSNCRLKTPSEENQN